LEEGGVAIKEEVNAKKQTFKGEEALSVVTGAKKVFVASGKKILEYDLASADKDELLKKITGPSGNLRAPTLKKGDSYYVGFNPEMYVNLS